MAKPIRLSKVQGIFAQNIALLIQHAAAKGYYVTFGEAYRPQFVQEKYYKEGRTKTLDSYHSQRLAVDFNLFYDGKYLTEKEKYRFLAEFWEDLHPNNMAGFFWGWDENHFEMRRYKRGVRV